MRSCNYLKVSQLSSHLELLDHPLIHLWYWNLVSRHALSNKNKPNSNWSSSLEAAKTPGDHQLRYQLVFGWESIEEVKWIKPMNISSIEFFFSSTLNSFDCLSEVPQRPSRVEGFPTAQVITNRGLSFEASLSRRGSVLLCGNFHSVRHQKGLKSQFPFECDFV